MATSGEKENSLILERFVEDDVKTAKRDMVLKFVMDQEALQTSLANLKVVDDKTIDLIDATMVVKDEESIGINHKEIQASAESGHHFSHAADYSPHSEECTDEGENRERVFVPRPPSGRRPRSNSKSTKQSLNVRVRRLSAKEMRSTTFSGQSSEQLSAGQRVVRCDESAAIIQRRDSSHSEYADLDSPRGLNSTWPRELMSRKLFGSLRNHSVYYAEPDARECPADSEDWDEGTRPKSSGHSLRHIPLDAEMVAARIASASDSQRISCKIGTLIRPGSSAGGRLAKSQKRKAFINFGLDPNLSFDGPLELEPVHPSEIPMFRSGSASSSGRSYTLMQLPPIVKEAPSH